MVLMHLVEEYVVLKVSGIVSNTWFLLGFIKILFREKYSKFVHAIISRGWGLCVTESKNQCYYEAISESTALHSVYIFSGPLLPNSQKTLHFYNEVINVQKFKNHKRVIWIKSCSRFEHLTYLWIHFHQSCFCF